MSLTSWLSPRTSRRPLSRRKSLAARSSFRPGLEALEDRWLPSTLTVMNNKDNGPGSLRAEIAAAQSGDTIVFDPSLGGTTITLKSGELLVNQNLTITGLGAGQLAVSGNNHMRVFEVAQGMQVTLSGLTISNGFATNGAGILVDTGAVLKVSASTLSGNSATQLEKFIGPLGGGIDNYGTATVSNCTLTNNASLAGGAGIYNHATLTVNNSLVSGNSFEGIANFATATISGTTLSGNSFSGIYNFGAATLTVLDKCIIKDNSANDGGGIWNAGTATISDSTITDNSASEYGGGIYSTISGTPGSGMLKLSGCTLSGNHATNGSGNNSINGYGGGIYITAGVATISGCTLSGNTADLEGGGIFVYGGAPATLNITGSTLSGNTAMNGGGVYLTYGTATISGSTLTGNSAASDGGGIFMYNATATLTNDTVTSNTATSFGGGIYIAAGAAVSLDAFTVAHTINNTDSSGLNGSTANID